MPSLISIPTPAAPQTPAVDSASRIPTSCPDTPPPPPSKRLSADNS